MSHSKRTLAAATFPCHRESLPKRRGGVFGLSTGAGQVVESARDYPH